MQPEGHQSNISPNFAQDFSLNHSFNVNLACQFGIQESILIHHLLYWISFNRRLKRNFIDGRTWMYQTQEEMAASMPYFNRRQVMRLIDSLVTQGVIIKGNYNKSTYDQTNWYAFKNEEMFTIVQKLTMENPEIDNQKSENGQPIPDTKTDSIKETTATTITPVAPRSEPVAVAVVSLDELPLNASEKASFMLQFSGEQLKHCIAYYKGRKEVAPDFIPNTDWASYLANATKEGYAVPSKPKKEDEARKDTFEENKRNATKFCAFLKDSLTEGQEIFLRDTCFEYRKGKQLVVVYFTDKEFVDKMKFIRNEIKPKEIK